MEEKGQGRGGRGVSLRFPVLATNHLLSGNDFKRASRASPYTETKNNIYTKKQKQPV